MTVWRLLWALLGHVLRGRGRRRVYVVTDDLPDAVQQELDDRDLAIVKTYAPYLGQDRFVVVIAKPEPEPVEVRGT
jgi:hypothetical protein